MLNNKRYVSLLSCLFGLMLAGCAATQPFGYAIVYDGAVAMRKLPHNDLSSWPWVDSNEVYISSCGFAQITFNETSIQHPQDTYRQNPRRKESYLWLMGEWCQAAAGLLEERGRPQYLIAYRNWHGTKYLMESARVYQDDAGVDYIAAQDFVEYASLEPLLRDLKQGPDQTGCFDPMDPEVAPIRASLIESEDHLCFRRGVYVRDLAAKSR